MALRLTQVGNKQGFSDGNIHYLSGNTTPGGDASFQDAAPIGSKYTFTSAGDTYVKVSLANNSILDWEIVPTDARMVAVETSASTNATNIAAEVTRAQAAEATNATAAATAQTQADLGVANAAAAQTQADLGVANAAVAQTQADLGVANAAAAQTTANAAIPTLEKAAANGVATLDANSTIPTSQLPPLAISTVSTVASEAAMLALVAQSGDVAVRSDLTSAAGNVFMHNGGTAGTIADWTQIDAGGYAVSSVNGQVGNIVLGFADVGADAAGAAAAVQTNLDSEVLRAQAAEAANGALIGTSVAGNYYLASDSLAAADAKIDAQVALNTADIATNSASIASNAATIATLSANTSGYSTSSFTAVTNQVVDSVPVAGLHRVEWDIAVTDNAVRGNMQTLKISAAYDGTTVEHDEDDALDFGSPINGLTYSVAVVGANVELTVSATGAVDINAVRRYL